MHYKGLLKTQKTLWKLTYSHRHSSPTSKRKVYYVDRRAPYDREGYLSPQGTANMFADLIAHRFGERVGNSVRVAPFFDSFIVIVER